MHILHQVSVGQAVFQHQSQWNWKGFYLCSTPGCGVTTHPSEIHLCYRQEEDHRLHSVNKLGCKHKDPKGWKFKQHQCYMQKEWKEGCADEDFVSLKFLHCHSFLEEQPKTM